jgi:hypothetical protein
VEYHIQGFAREDRKLASSLRMNKQTSLNWIQWNRLGRKRNWNAHHLALLVGGHVGWKVRTNATLG